MPDEQNVHQEMLAKLRELALDTCQMWFWKLHGRPLPKEGETVYFVDHDQIVRKGTMEYLNVDFCDTAPEIRVEITVRMAVCHPCHYGCQIDQIRNESDYKPELDVPNEWHKETLEQWQEAQEVCHPPVCDGLIDDAPMDGPEELLDDE